MKKTLQLLLLSVLLAFGSACSQEETINEGEDEINQDEQMEEETEVDQEEQMKEETEVNQEKQTKEENKKSESEKGENSITNEQEQGDDPSTVEKNEPTEKDERKNLADSLKEKEIVGKQLNDVKQLLGEPTVEAKDSILHVWRYDFPINDYVFDNKLNAVDVEGLYNEQMEAQLMVFYENNIATSYSIYFLKEDEIMHYRETAQGSEEYSASQD